MTPTELEKLAERVEAATGPDRKLDGAIDALLNRRPKNGDYDGKEGCLWQDCNGYSGLCVRPDGYARKSFCARDYTASLDAAMTLVPEGWRVSSWCEHREKIMMAEGRTHTATLTRDDETPLAIGFASSFALALCAAALRARAQAEGK